MSRHCDAIECGGIIQPGRFLCINHWRMVGQSTQRTINARYRICRADFGFLSDIAYLQACIDAIEAIAASEGRAMEPTTYHRLLAAAKRKAAA
jgi:hypothetical protein